MKGQRNSAHLHIKALDHQLFLCLGIGLTFFACAEGETDLSIVNALFASLHAGGYLSIPPTLVLHLDEGSPAYSMTWFLSHHKDLRIMAQRDIYHREWNDIELALSGAMLWHVVILMFVVFNMPFGPWESHAWWNKIRESAERMLETMHPSNPLFSAFYGLICKDLDLDKRGTAEHKDMVWRTIFSNNAFRVAGNRVSLRRWFGWLSSAEFHLPLWNTRLLAITAMGQQLGVYKSWHDVPLWKAQSEWVKTRASDEIVASDDEDMPALGDDDEADDGTHGDIPNPRGEPVVFGAAAADQARAAAEGIAGARAAPVADDDKGTTKDEAKSTLRELRAKSKNTVFVAAHILSRDNCRIEVAIILELCRAVWTAHSRHASECRDSDNVLLYYQRSAQAVDYMRTLEDTASVFLDMQKLRKIGFTTEFGQIPQRTKPIDEGVQVETANAQTMFDLFCGITYHRMTSMTQLSRALPGYLALLSSDDDEIFKSAYDRLLKDYRVYTLAVEKSRAATFIKKLLRSSPFQTRIVREVALIATLQDPGVTYNDRRHLLRKYTEYMFRGWGQTKIVEDTFRECRYVETQGVLNKTRSMEAYYCAMASKGTIALHNRTEITLDCDQAQASQKSQEIFNCKSYVPSLPDAQSITNRATWVSYSPQSAKTIQTDLMLLEHVHDTDAWAYADRCSHCDYFQKRSVIRRVSDGVFYLVCGVLLSKLLVVWQLEAVSVGRGKDKQAFLLGGGQVLNTTPQFLAIFDFDLFEVLPATAVSPMHYFMALGRKLPACYRMGVVLLQHGAPLPVMLHAAQNAFFTLDLTKLKSLCAEEDIDTPGVTLAMTLTACIKFVVKKYTKKTPTDTELNAIVSLRCAEEANLVGEICDEDMLIDILDKDDQTALRELSCVPFLILPILNLKRPTDDNYTIPSQTQSDSNP